MRIRKTFFTLGLLIVTLLLITCSYQFLSHRPDAIKPSLNSLQKQLYVVGQSTSEEPINVQASVQPQFSLKLAEEKFKNLWTAHASERRNLVNSEIVNLKGDRNLKVETEFNDKSKQLMVTPLTENKFKPGLYTLNVKIKTYTGEEETITQDFTWGVLAINTNKGFYIRGDKVEIGMAVLDNYGITKCIAGDKVVFGTAKLRLTITSPSGKKEYFSTDDKTIIGSKTCSDRSFTNIPDFLANTTANESGRYQMHIEALTFLGTHAMDSYFNVRDFAPYTIERVQYPMRIYPRFDYPVKIKFVANRDFSGSVYDVVPSNFDISQISDHGEIIEEKPYKAIEWQVNWTKGNTYYLQYSIHFPPVSPEFYLVGPIKIGDFSEGREWQIASDSLFTLVQEVNNTQTGSANISATFATGVTSGNLLIMNCMRTSATSWGTIASWTREFRNTSSTPRIAQYYRVVSAGTAGSDTFTCSSTSSSGELAIDLMEFSGNATTSVADKTVTVRTGRTCNTSSNTTNSLTPTNPDELLVAAFANGTSGRTVLSHTTTAGTGYGFLDSDVNGGSNGFSGSTGSYDSSYAEAINTPPVAATDFAQFSGSGTCTNGMAAYNPTVTVSQGSYQFFDNIDSLTPSTTFNNGATAVNTPITLNNPNQQFRLRILLDVDSATGASFPADTGDFVLQFATLPLTGNCADGVYSPVSTSSAIAYNVNPSQAGKLLPPITASASDPADVGYTTRLQNYVELYISDNPDADVRNKQLSISNNQAGLWDLSLVDASDDSTSVTYCLALFDSGLNPLDSYHNYPKVTTIPLDVNIRGGSILNSGTTIQ
jgi:hypothetical protein